jgi:hypothetical protein
MARSLSCSGKTMAAKALTARVLLIAKELIGALSCSRTALLA